MMQRKLLDENKFAFYLSTCKPPSGQGGDETCDGSQVTFGGVDETKFSGDIHWVSMPITQKALGYWYVNGKDFKAGPLLACTKCLDVRKSEDRNSCPKGTKIFAPSSKTDWTTLLGSAKALKDPHWIVDITRPQNGCGGCTSNPMNSHNLNQKSWKTSDGAPWWLRSDKYKEPSGDYSANCFMNLATAKG